jgi:hypothetical protein
MRALKGGIPRAFPDGRSHAARVYRVYVASIAEQLFGTLADVPKYAWPVAREAGRCVVELERVGVSLDEALARKRRRDSARARRQLVTLRTQLLAFERRLEELAASVKPRSFAEAARAAGGSR